MAYTVTEFNTHVAAGDPVKLTASGAEGVVLHFGKTSTFLTQVLKTKTVDGAKNIDPVTNITSDNSIIDLGVNFSKEDIQNSIDVKQAIADVAVLAEAGTAPIV